jgi:outer membrane protein OmpA-like peptidoglycan-associated protein
MKTHRKENYWISLSDIMTGLMVIFLFISISYMVKVKQREEEKDEMVESFQNVKVELYNELKNEFENDFREDKWHAVIDEDLSIRFLNERVLFDYDSYRIKPEFKKILDDFFPRYLEILLKEKYRNKILEVRIEGHTDSRGNYMYNVKLSQNRTRSVLDYVLFNGNEYFLSLTDNNKELVRFWLIANGFSSGRTLDNNMNYTINSGKAENTDKSRRVEFRIVTKTDELLDEILKKIKEQ